MAMSPGRRALCLESLEKMVEESREIGTTGPSMYRYFFTVDEAVDLVVNALENIDEISGKSCQER